MTAFNNAELGEDHVKAHAYWHTIECSLMRSAQAGTPLIVGFLLTAVTLLSAAPRKSIERTHWEEYTTVAGMPSDRVLCVAVDASRVWAGTDSGLVLIERGRIKKVFTPSDGLASQVVTALEIDEQTGDLWIGTYGGLSRYSAGEFRTYTNLSSGLANDIVYDVSIQHPFVWAATAVGLSRLDLRLGTWTTFDSRNSPMNDPWPESIAFNNGRLFVGTWGSGVLEYNIAEDRWTSHLQQKNPANGTLPSGIDPEIVVSVASDTSSGMIWSVTNQGTIQTNGGVGNRQETELLELKRGSVNALRVHGGVLWLCSSRGVDVYDVGSRSWITDRFFASQVDLANSSLTAVASPTGPSARRRAFRSNAFDVAFHGDDVWIATDNGLFAKTSEEAIRSRRRDCRSYMPAAAPPPGKAPTVAPRRYDSKSSSEPSAINIGFFGPVGDSPEAAYGVAMLHGAEMAIDEANERARNQRSNIRFELKIHDDSGIWGGSTTEPVTMAMDEHVVAILGSIDGAATHTLLHIATRLGVPVVNSGTSDADVVENGGPWLVDLFPNDRLESAALAKYIERQRKIRTVGILREDLRYARVGSRGFKEQAERSRQISTTEASFRPGETDFRRQLREFQDAKVDALIIWCRPPEGAAILRQMRELGMRIPAFGPSYLATSRFIQLAGTAAEGFSAAAEYNPERADDTWKVFQKSYRKRFGQSPDSYAAYAYDGMTLLTKSIQTAGVDRVGLMKHLIDFSSDPIKGVTGTMRFDGNHWNKADLVISRVEGARLVYLSPDSLHEPMAATGDFSQGK